ncbi:MAG: tyrosine-type recombinase/integrase [Lachnospiraceae bacterium]|jgi:integrase|nr:tyrosine-type recombinase/integrase [Lachnospiraceae bacterium]
MSTTQPIRNKHHIRAIAEYHLKRGEFRNHLLVVMCTHTALRVSDLLRLTWNDVYDFDRQCIRESIAIIEKKTGKSKIISLNNTVNSALKHCLPAAVSGDALIKSRKGTNKAISRVQAYRIITAAAEALSFGTKVSCHSLRKTFGYHAWKSGASPAVIMEIYNHSNFAVTCRYLGVAQDDKDEVYHKLAEVV